MPRTPKKPQEEAEHVPKFCFTGTSSSKSMVLAATPEACSVAAGTSRLQTDRPAKSPETVERVARRACRGKATDKLILANSQLQFSKYRDQTLDWSPAWRRKQTPGACNRCM